MKSILASIILVLGLAANLWAQGTTQSNVDLSTVPSRDTVQLTIYNSEDLTLVRETRKVSFKRGVNPLQFSWANTLIDPTSVQLRFLTQPDKLELLDTTFPHQKPQMLYWNVQSEIDGEATIEITFFTSGISWAADYLALAATDEKEMSLEGFVRINNNSGEEYEDAQVRLVVGKVNLVEKIAQLARVSFEEADSLARGERGRVLKKAVARDALAKDKDADAEGATWGALGAMARPGSRPAKPKEIIKEGLSEYFIYTIEGTETIPNGWGKRMRSFQGQTVPLKIQYRYRPAEYGDRLVRMYLLANDKESKLGTTPLPDGVVRVFRNNGRDGLSFLVAQAIKYIPIGDKIELNLGPDREVLFELVKLRTWRDTVWMQVQGADIFRQVDQPGIEIEVNSAVSGWDDHTLFAQRVRNYSGKAIDLEIRRTLPGHVVFRSQLPAKNFDFQTVEYTADVKPTEKVDLLYEIVQRQGHNVKQNNVTIEQAPVKP